MFKDSWFFPITESLHLVGIALMVGAIVLGDLRTLGSPGKNVSASWTAAGLLLVALTSPVLFFANVSRYVDNPAFVVKMILLLLAIVAHFTLHRRPTRLSAIVSIALWACVLLGGRAIADFDV